jgi:hypothetical protein
MLAIMVIISLIISQELPRTMQLHGDKTASHLPKAFHHQEGYSKKQIVIRGIKKTLLQHNNTVELFLEIQNGKQDLPCEQSLVISNQQDPNKASNENKAKIGTKR